MWLLPAPCTAVCQNPAPCAAGCHNPAPLQARNLFKCKMEAAARDVSELAQRVALASGWVCLAGRCLVFVAKPLRSGSFMLQVAPSTCMHPGPVSSVSCTLDSALICLGTSTVQQRCH